jgi:flagellar L-ring protein precursor FlgH
MNVVRVTLLGLALGTGATPAWADSLWERRDPNAAYLFVDYRARKVGDLLTIVVHESTEFEGLEKSEMNKETKKSAFYKLAATGSHNGGSHSFAADFDGIGASQRKFDGKNNSTIDRKFLDRMTVTVVDVLPNGNLVVEGYRQRVLNREVRVLRVSGVVRPADIGGFNTVQSQYIADFVVNYAGRGPESSYTNHGWMGRALNVLWPY